MKAYIENKSIAGRAQYHGTVDRFAIIFTDNCERHTLAHFNVLSLASDQRQSAYKDDRTCRITTKLNRSAKVMLISIDVSSKEVLVQDKLSPA